jgi:cephalosporin-C deacetylase-like acetyl esterase
LRTVITKDISHFSDFKNQLLHWANADSAIVHADFRGNGLQRLMLEAALPLFPKKITHIGATVSPFSA